jgi:hypothetical protein
MRFLVWACRVILVVVIAAFVATVFYMTHNVGTSMDSALPALDLITVIGAGLVGLLWPLMRRYWQALFLLIGLGVFRGLFGRPGLANINTQLPTHFQDDFLWASMGVTALALVVALVVRAILGDRALRALKQAPAIPAPVSSSAPPAPPVSLMVPEPQPVVATAETQASTVLDDTTATSGSKRKK